jgi:hypothetical protein
MVALLPALATVIGIIVLAQIPSWTEVAGVALVIAGVALHRRPSSAAKEDTSTLTPQQLAARASANGQTPGIERRAAAIDQPYNNPGAHAPIHS